MGLDLLDITYRIEKEFGVDLTEDDLTDVSRDHDIVVGSLYDLLLTKMHFRDVVRNDFRVNHDLWLELQGVLHCVTQTPLDAIELSSPLAQLFPREERRATWNELRDACRYRVRELDYPRIVRAVGLLLAAGMVLIEQFQVWQIPGVQWFWPLLGVLGIWMFAETYMKVLWLCAPLRTRFPAGMATVKDLCRAVLATNYTEICEGAEIPLDRRCHEVWQQLVEILVDTLDVDAEQITFRSRLVRDLGMG